MGIVRLPIASLLLDVRNPRLEGAKDQNEALEQMLADQDDKLYELADDIVNEGMSPIDRLLVIKSESPSKKYIVLEGNRRLAALRILTNPAVLTGLTVKDSLRKRFELLAKKFTKASIEPIDAFAVKDRLEGNRWIYLRHTGENDGKGVVGWKGLATARFRAEDPALQALEFVRANGNLSADVLAKLEKNFPITTLDRLIRTPAVRSLMGIRITGSKLETIIPTEEALKPLRKIVNDLAMKLKTVSDLKSKQQQVDYVTGLPKSDKPDLSVEIDPIPLNDAKIESKPTKKPKPKAAAQRLTIAPKNLALSIPEPRIAAVFKELTRMKAPDFPNAGAVLLRVFLELSVDAILAREGIPLTFTHKGHTGDKKLKTKVKEAIDALVAKGAAAKTFLSITLGVDKASSALYMELLHAYVHNNHVTPKPSELITTWDDAQPFFEAAWQ